MLALPSLSVSFPRAPTWPCWFSPPQLLSGSLPTDLLMPSPFFKTHLTCHLLQEALPDPSSRWGMLPPPPLRHFHLILHCNNFCTCLSSHLHPSLEKVKGSDLIDLFHLCIQSTRSRNWCAIDVPLQPVYTVTKLL